MNTGDKVLALLGVKVICCGLLILAATGALGGVGAWLIDGSGRWLLAGAFVAAIAAIILGKRDRIVTHEQQAAAHANIENKKRAG
ncbi:MAG: hypothetical protein HY659_02085 [Rhizobiales bacterium]|nr:hypothetical protein [Hyphomicrobiales bacterium]